MTIHLWLRSETKDNEARCPLTPQDAKVLVNAGFKVSVEQFPSRIFPEQDYYEVGCEIVKEHSWKESTKDTIILGLKEFSEEEVFPLEHRHIHFAHVFKGQNGSKNFLNRFHEGKGKLFDLEYLTNDDGRRVVAFGKWAGYVGAGIALDRYFQKQDQSQKNYPALKIFSNKEKMVEQIKHHRDLASKKDPSIIIIGAAGRCGGGAQQLLDEVGISHRTLWDRDETEKGGPFSEIIQNHIFINTVLVTEKLPPFLDRYTLNKNKNLSVIADVSCDPTSELNPIPLYHSISSWQTPFFIDRHSLVDILAVDNLPSVLPKESSMEFSHDLLPILLSLQENPKMEALPVWRNAHQKFTQTMDSYFK